MRAQRHNRIPTHGKVQHRARYFETYATKAELELSSSAISVNVLRERRILAREMRSISGDRRHRALILIVNSRCNAGVNLIRAAQKAMCVYAM